MHDTTTRTTQRLERFVRGWLSSATYRDRAQLTVSAWEVPDEPVPFAQAREAQYTPFEVGTPWGKPWGTVWFHVTGTVPAHWADLLAATDDDGAALSRLELVVDLGFSGAGPGFQAEGTVYAPDGAILKAVEPLNQYVPLTIGPGGEIDVYVEAAANPDVPGGSWWRPTPMGDKATAGPDPIYTLKAVDIALLDVPTWELAQDVWTLDGLMRVLPADLPRRAEILRALENMLDAVDPEDLPGTARDGRAALAGVLASPAYASAHRVHAVGHAHIDSAWLWPVRETVRKCARTFSNVLALMDADPDFTFACSSAQQYAWIQEYYPELFARIAERVREGRFVPVGGMWVESDTNMPGSEAMARQFVEGTGFFMDELGVEPRDVWLPDSFGYSGALPQIARAAGKEFFLTQKISWNDTNTMPHHTFDWEGTDGSRIFTHFPPVDTYNASLSGEELARAQRQYAEKGRANTSLAPFGHGDGGGGPTREMVAAARRTADLEGSPRVVLSSPAEFFDVARAEYSRPPVWSGELYLEYHRGTYTSQHRTKAGNRRSEHLLREAELWASTATVRTGAAYPYEALQRLWRLVLLQQFHDILPGSSIAWVHREAERNYAEIAAELEQMIATAIATVAGDGERDVVVNAGPFAREGVPALGGATAPAAPASGAALTREGDDVVLDNGRIRVRVDARGLVTSVRDLAADREVLAPGSVAGLLQVHRDIPNEWEAWDIDEHYRRDVTDLVDVDAVTVLDDVDGEPGAVGVEVARSYGTSRLVQRFVLRPEAAVLDLTTSVDWRERRKLLKLAFALDVHADRATSEIQFGHVHRATAVNTSWDHARFETVAHRWVHVGEPGYGVAVGNDQTYGHDITRTTREDGGTTTLVRQSLLRAPMFPDPDADQGEHVLRSSLVVGAEIADAVEEGYRINLPLRRVRGASEVEPLLRVSDPAVVVEAVKLARDGSGDVVVRLYESRGGRASARVTPTFAVAGARATDLLERDAEAPGVTVADDGAVDLALRPFQIVTLRYARASGRCPHRRVPPPLAAGSRLTGRERRAFQPRTRLARPPRGVDPAPGLAAGPELAAGPSRLEPLAERRRNARRAARHERVPGGADVDGTDSCGAVRGHRRRSVALRGHPGYSQRGRRPGRDHAGPVERPQADPHRRRPRRRGRRHHRRLVRQHACRRSLLGVLGPPPRRRRLRDPWCHPDGNGREEGPPAARCGGPGAVRAPARAVARRLSAHRKR
ncbi:glycoside hydrolase family 38 [Beutenbergia cavernae DSM 12333]|uniref:Glycoside hydrolase family 38 n=1 Tax=Beutenbergia cavernae (strain ATCC BAA-8 / DSM 12333 / CCUG 43141 / JCM 11478 / NBRC 16432 / NCIMB 13614 / HKI 0122) TaxID=471853 RepID=C5BZR4_BEUC1|nr:glycoside hydrolase family 38 [Beutenbergia cavernae DSM 12333]